MPKGVELSFEFRGQRWGNAQKGLEAFADALGKGVDGLAPTMRKEMQFTLEGVAEALAQRHGNPWPGGTTSKTLSMRSGEGIQSIRDSVKVIGRTIAALEGEIGAPGYMGVHEKGATITPKKAKFLTIPMPEALNPNGTPKKKSAREWDDTYVGRTKAGNLMIFQKRGLDIVPLYLLVKRVKIPPRLGMEETINTAIPYFVDRAMDAMATALRQAVAKK